jgi:hypothetical protein
MASEFSRASLEQPDLFSPLRDSHNLARTPGSKQTAPPPTLLVWCEDDRARVLHSSDGD